MVGIIILGAAVPTSWRFSGVKLKSTHIFDDDDDNDEERDKRTQ